MRALRQVAPGTAGNLGGDRLARAIDYPLLVVAAGIRQRRPWRRTGGIRCWAIRSAGSPAASWRRGTRAVCAPDAAIAFV